MIYLVLPLTAPPVPLWWQHGSYLQWSCLSLRIKVSGCPPLREAALSRIPPADWHFQLIGQNYDSWPPEAKKEAGQTRQLARILSTGRRKEREQLPLGFCCHSSPPGADNSSDSFIVETMMPQERNFRQVLRIRKDQNQEWGSFSVWCAVKTNSFMRSSKYTWLCKQKYPGDRRGQVNALGQGRAGM